MKIAVTYENGEVYQHFGHTEQFLLVDPDSGAREVVPAAGEGHGALAGFLAAHGVTHLVCGGIGVLFIIMGNFMPQIKQNYTFGCRTPWALNDAHNWQRTQRMGGYTFIVMGIVLLVLAFFGGLLGDIATLAVLLVAVLGGSAWIYLYSYLVYVGKMK